MKVAVLGATGPTGVEVVKQALELGYDVVALVRDPEKLATLVKHDKLKVHKVDVTKQEDLVGPLKGVDGIVSAWEDKQASGRRALSTQTL
ncbi:hypothetical protein C0Q70_21431 [Pomacea canaliculata]|uniref:NAD(P)-binding domain-containing protein n=1 Tax=Pomacea canaliculata TaxID=400727 RepID=A0A2T7NCH4_POMCA|nr:hypothetical protein C0Q70_21431 [Pomacea canaliculata]